MNKYQLITAEEAKIIMQEKGIILFDVRDKESFEQNHINGAIHLTENNIQNLVFQTSRQETILVISQTGNSSKNIASYFILREFDKVYSVIGGYNEWNNQLNRHNV